ncbi:hypothetical protein [Novosphingobium sp. BL-52-GroH]|uniref:DUF7079 family protein n=1 Tax=Novosphingobium sp. BL-52-GroH TaxID=3349877 RepID=UPI00384E57FB
MLKGPPLAAFAQLQQHAILATRLPVWTALSHLFLDTELDAHDVGRIARVLEQSPYVTSEIEAILRDEVLPAFGGNLLSTWGMVEDDWRRVRALL